MLEEFKHVIVDAKVGDALEDNDQISKYISQGYTIIQVKDVERISHIDQNRVTVIVVMKKVTGGGYR